MPISKYIQQIRTKIGKDLLFTIGAAGVVINEHGEILLQRRSDFGTWGLPGGTIEPGENPADAVVREVWEETGIHVVPEQIIGVFSGPEFHTLYPNGDEAMYVSITFRCRPVGGTLQVDGDESLEVRYFRSDELPALDPRNTLRIEIALRNDPRTYFRWNGQQADAETESE